MSRGDEPRDKPHRGPSGPSVPAAASFAGTIMAVIARALLFDDDDKVVDDKDGDDPSSDKEPD